MADVSVNSAIRVFHADAIAIEFKEVAAVQMVHLPGLIRSRVMPIDLGPLSAPGTCVTHRYQDAGDTPRTLEWIRLLGRVLGVPDD